LLNFYEIGVWRQCLIVPKDEIVNITALIGKMKKEGLDKYL